MKVIRTVRQFVTQPPKRKIIIASITLCLVLIGTTAYSYYHYRNKNNAATIETKTTKPTSVEPTIQHTPSEGAPLKDEETKVSTEPQATTPAAATTKPTTSQPPQPRPKPTPGPSTSIDVTPLSFSAGRIETAYAYCADNVLLYLLSGVSVFANKVTSASFTWKIELNDGTVSDSGTSTMPNSASWHSFPSTPDYPSSLGSIEGAEDGDMARLVITSPNYSAGPWSAPVPAGSQADCQS